MNARLLALSLSLGLLLGSGAGCAVAVGTSGPFHVPSDSQDQCRSQCAKIGMGLGAVAIMANNVGCVCQPSGSASRPHAAAITAGMAAIATQEERQGRPR